MPLKFDLVKRWKGAWNDCHAAIYPHRLPKDKWERDALFARIRQYSTRLHYVSWNIGAIVALYSFGDSDLIYFISNPSTIIIWFLYHCLQISSMTFYCITTFSDPGYITREKDKINNSRISEDTLDTTEKMSLLNSDSESKTNETNDININIESIENNSNNSLIVVDKDNPPPHFCWRCKFIRPIRSKHCWECDRCTAKFDHHCPMVANCVGGKNHRYFVSFITTESIIVLWTLYMSFICLVGYNDKNTTLAKRGYISWIFRIILFICMIFASFVCVSLAGFHIYLMFTGQTTYEIIKPNILISYLDTYINNDYKFNTPNDNKLTVHKSKNNRHNNTIRIRNGNGNGNTNDEIDNNNNNNNNINSNNNSTDNNLSSAINPNLCNKGNYPPPFFKDKKDSTISNSSSEILSSSDNNLSPQILKLQEKKQNILERKERKKSNCRRHRETVMYFSKGFITNISHFFKGKMENDWVTPRFCTVINNDKNNSNNNDNKTNNNVNVVKNVNNNN